MINKTDLLLVDGKNVIYHCEDKEIYNNKGDRRGIFVSFINRINSFRLQFPNKETIVCWDGGISQRRKEIYPEYKKRPREHNYELEEQVFELHNYMGDLGIKQIRLQSIEADDIIAYLTKIYTGEIMILSADKDFLQLVSDRVNVYNFTRNILVSLENFEEYCGLTTPMQFLEYLVMRGDSVDRVPGIKGMGEIRTKKFIEYFSLENLPLSKRATSHYLNKLPKTIKDTLENPEILKDIDMNRKLISLREDWIGMREEAKEKIRKVLFAKTQKDIKQFKENMKIMGLTYDVDMSLVM